MNKILKVARMKKNLSQGQLATMLGFSSPQFISNIERGLCLLPPRHFKLAAKILGLSLTDLTKHYMRSVHAQMVKEIGG